jgi:hypothetical protein
MSDFGMKSEFTKEELLEEGKYEPRFRDKHPNFPLYLSLFSLGFSSAALIFVFIFKL